MGKTLSDMVFDFSESDYQTQTQTQTQTQQIESIKEEEEEEEEEEPHQFHTQEETYAFWQSHHQLLQEALSHSSPTETRIRASIEDAIQKARLAAPKECDNLLQTVADLLRDSSHDSAICKSKWRRSPEDNFPPGEHSYIDVIYKPKSAKKRLIRVVIELNFRAEFEMARASPVYNGLVGRLPEVFVGKPERLRSVVRVMCDAVKRCMKENKMHMAPWRKQKYMESKWLGKYERVVVPSTWAGPVRASELPAARPRASMLTFDLHCSTATVEVV